MPRYAIRWTETRVITGFIEADSYEEAFDDATERDHTGDLMDDEEIESEDAISRTFDLSAIPAPEPR